MRLQLPNMRLLILVQATAVALHQAKMPGHFPMQAQVRMDDVVQAALQVSGLSLKTSEGCQQLLVKLFDQVEQQVLLARVMVIQRAWGKPQERCQLTHADLAKTLAGEQLQG